MQDLATPESKIVKRIVIDLDGTLTFDDPPCSYEDKLPNLAVIERLRQYRGLGFAITILTSRNMRTFAGDLDMIRRHTLPKIEAWLERHSVPYDEIVIGKPWCGQGGFYVDDRSLRPDEFARLDPKEAQAFFDRL